MKHLLLIHFAVIVLINLLLVNCSFQTSFFSKMNKDYKGKNLIISPLSVFQVLSLTLNGAAGETQKEMCNVLGNNTLEKINELNYDILELSKDFSTVEMANGIMSKFDFLPSFIEISEKYLAPRETLESVEQVNNWCDKKTHGKIKKILERLDNIVTIILNAIYFKGEWINKFDSYFTTKKPFYNFNKEQNENQIDTMKQEGSFNYYEDSDIQAVELLYKEDSMSALIILPSKDIDINDYISSLEKKNELNKIEKNLKKADVKLELPKFEVDFSSSLVSILKDMGMKKAFSNEADFSGLRKEGGIKISEVIQKTFLKVTEDGTEAAAVTMVAMDEAEIIYEKLYEMKINRPFLFIIKSKKLPKDYDILFMSKIEEIK